MWNRLSRRGVLAIACVGIGTWALGGGPTSCKSQTAGEEISFDAAVGGGTESGKSGGEEFTTYAGWNVSLSKAIAAVGPVYYYAGEPQASLFDSLFGIRSAHACPTHAQYNKGAVLGEIVRQYAVDLLGAPTKMGTVPGLAGVCQTIELHLHPPGKLAAGTSATPFSDLQGNTIVLEGEATKLAKRIPFRAQFSLPEEGVMQIVESVSASVPLRDAAEQPGFIMTEVLLDQWLATVDFDTLTEREGEIYLFSESTQASTALLRGVRSRLSYRISWRSS